MTEVSKGNKNQIQKEHVLCHCRTKLNVKTTTFLWSITNFWNIYNIANILTSSNIEGQSFKIEMRIDREEDKLFFFICCNSNDQINILSYNVYIQGIEGSTIGTNWKSFYSNIIPLYDIDLKILADSVYLSSDTLSVYFMFQTYENVSHSIMCENISETQSLTTAMNNFTFDESDSFVTFIIDEKCLRVKKSLILRANSSTFNDMLNSYEYEEKDIEISNVTYDIFQLILFYLETSVILNLKSDASDSANGINKWHALLEAANIFQIKDLKELCEKRLIEHTLKENVVQHLDIAIKNNAVRLENYAKRFIKLHLDDIINITEFLDIVKINPEILFDILKQKLFEENVILIPK